MTDVAIGQTASSRNWGCDAVWNLARAGATIVIATTPIRPVSKIRSRQKVRPFGVPLLDVQGKASQKLIISGNLCDHDQTVLGRLRVLGGETMPALNPDLVRPLENTAGALTIEL